MTSVEQPTTAGLVQTHSARAGSRPRNNRGEGSRGRRYVTNAAIYQTDDIRRIKATEKAYFEAQPVNVNPLKLMLGSVFSAEVSTSDQQGKPVTATFETIARYLKKYDTGSELIELTPQP